MSTTTKAESCSCIDEIEKLNGANEALRNEVDNLRESTSKEIVELKQLNEEIEKRLSEVEMKLREILSMPCGD